MSPKPTSQLPWVQIPGICFMRKPDGAMRCTFHPDHRSDHRNVYSGPLTNGFRAGTGWPRRPGEKQAD